MASYTIQEDKNFKWVSEIIINTDYPIDISSDIFNITVKDQLEYFIKDYLNNGDTFELEELLKNDTLPTLVISNNSLIYKEMDCFRCGCEGEVVCPVCNGTGEIYTDLLITATCTGCNGNKKIICPDCNGTGKAMTVCDDPPKPIMTEVTESNIFQYNNSDYDSLVKNGIQFWVDGITKKQMHIRLVTKGHSSVNPYGYSVFNPITQEYENTEYVGFTIADFNIKLNSLEKLMFTVCLIPRVIMDNPTRMNPDAKESPHILSGDITRVDYDWNDNGQGLDNLYVNNSAASALEYDQYPVDMHEIYWKSSATSAKAYLTPEYVVKSSAFVNDYLVEGSATDLITGELSSRNFNITSSMLVSQLYNEYTLENIELPFDFDDVKIETINYLESNGNVISGDLYYNEITQHLVCSGDKPSSNQVKLSIEI